MKFLLFLLLGAIPGAANANTADVSLVANLKSKGQFRCTELPKKDGHFCVRGKLSIVVPKGMARFQRSVFYAHGLVGVCGNGASGENYLKPFVGSLKKIGAIGVMPYRASASDASYDLAGMMQSVDKITGGGNLPWRFAGHSAGGAFMAKKLASPSIASRVDKVLVLDGVYTAPEALKLWRHALTQGPFSVSFISGSTYQAATQVTRNLKNSRAKLHSRSSTGHCEFPQAHLHELAL